MTNMWSIAFENLTSVAVLAFVLGCIAARIKSDIRLPDQVYQFISIYLLFGIGLKGGHAIQKAQFEEIVRPAFVTMLLGVLIPFLAFSVLKLIRSLTDLDRGAIAAHYGSTSLVTFSAALYFLDTHAIKSEGYLTVLLVLMEIPGLVVGVFLGSRHVQKEVDWKHALLEVVAGKTVLLLVGGLAIGWIASPSGYEKVSPLFVGIQGGILALFLMHLGHSAGSHLAEIRKVGIRMTIFGVVFPLLAGSLGVLAGTSIGMSVGGATVLGVLTASASYIAAPAAVSIGLPGANAPLALMSSIGVTFPFNLVFGIPIYLEMAKLFS